MCTIKHAVGSLNLIYDVTYPLACMYIVQTGRMDACKSVFQLQHAGNGVSTYAMVLPASLLLLQQTLVHASLLLQYVLTHVFMAGQKQFPMHHGQLGQLLLRSSNFDTFLLVSEKSLACPVDWDIQVPTAARQLRRHLA